jgi:hypothetical protein
VRIIALVAVAICLTGGSLSAEEKAVKSRIASVGLFKNGLAVVKREVAVPGPGTYRLDDVPEPVHGTYWVESPATVETAALLREVEVPAEPTGINLQEELAGKKVTVHFRGDKLTPLAGTVVPPPKKPAEDTPRPGWEAGYAYRAAPEAAGRFLILQTPRGRAYVDQGDIAYYEAEGVGATVKRRKPVLLLTVGAEAKEPTTVKISYLAHGLAWAPSYRVDTTDGKRLTLEQSAVIKNEMTDLADAEVSLITGFPSVQFAHVISPLSAHSTWAMFFQQLNQRPQSDQGVLSNSVRQQAVMFNYGAQGPQVNIMPGHEGVDLFYHTIGKRTLARGTALSLTTRKGQADYEHIVEWLIADHRDAYGNPAGRPSEDPETGEVVDLPWDALRFKNPFPFPLTTGPALVSTKGRFNGQRMTSWVNAGQETTLRVTKALSLRTRSVENEEQTGNAISDREIVNIGGRRFRKSTVVGELSICNHRPEEIKLLIRRRFSGDLLKAAEDPKVTLLEEGVYTVNKRNELVWTVTLKPGEEKTLPYRYAVLVSF